MTHPDLYAGFRRWLHDITPRLQVEGEARLMAALLGATDDHEIHAVVTAEMAAHAELHPIGAGLGRCADLDAPLDPDVEALIARLTGDLRTETPR